MDNWLVENNVVLGLRVRVTPQWLRAHLRARAAHHEKRAQEKREFLPQLEDAAAKLKQQSPATTVGNFNKSSTPYRFDGDDAVEQLKSDIESHQNKAVAFSFLASALFDMDYCLDQADLVKLEVLK